MADNVVLSSGTGGGATVATDDVGGVHYQIIKHAFGALDTATVVTSAAGLPVTVTSSSVSAASTAATNPWSSAPSFNVPVVSASSGLVQALTSGTLFVNVNATNLDATRSIVSVTTISKLSSSPGTLWRMCAISTFITGLSVAVPIYVRLYNATTSNVSVGTSMAWISLANVCATSTGGAGLGVGVISNYTEDFGPRGLWFSAGCSADFAALTSGAVATTAAGGFGKISYIYTSS